MKHPSITTQTESVLVVVVLVLKARAALVYVSIMKYSTDRQYVSYMVNTLYERRLDD